MISTDEITRLCQSFGILHKLPEGKQEVEENEELWVSRDGKVFFPTTYTKLRKITIDIIMSSVKAAGLDNDIILVPEIVVDINSEDDVLAIYQNDNKALDVNDMYYTSSWLDLLKNLGVKVTERLV